MMVDLYLNFPKSLTNEMMFGWHKMLMSGDRTIRTIGAYRTHPEPMQVISGPIAQRKVHFEAPPSENMAKEMAAFVQWFNDTGPDGRHPLPALTRSGIAHLYFVSIHPFEDGNGRIARALAEKSLAQNLGQPTLIMMGTDDPIVPMANGHILKKLIPNAQLITVDDGHLFLVTNADWSGKKVSEFLDS